MKFVTALFVLLIQFTAPLIGGTPVIGATPAKKSPPYYRQRNVTVPQAAQAAGDPVVVNAASFEPGISPGGLATIFGQGLSNVSGVVVANTDPLPLQLADVSVIVNGIYAPLFSVAYANGEDQISFQVPWETPTGPGAATLEILSNGRTVGFIQSDSFTEDPGIFMYGGRYAVAARPSDYSLIGPRNPARPGEVIILYTTGLGPVSLNIPDGYSAPLDRLAYTVDPFQVVVDGEQAQVLFSGLAPGFVGLYQINLRLPFDLPPGNLDIQILSPFANSGTATLPVQ